MTVPYERRLLAAFAILFFVLFFFHIYLHQKQAVRLSVAALATKRGESVQKPRFVEESAAISGHGESHAV